MNDLNRFFPAILGALAILGCLLPFGDKGNLFSLPDAIAQAGNPVGFMGSGSRASGVNGASLTFAVWIARLVFLVPIVAVWVIVQNFRGNVGKALQWAAAATWILVRILVPYFVSRALLASMPPFLRDMANAFGGNNSTFFSLNFGIGGWVLILSGVGMALLAKGLLRFPQPSSSSPTT